MQSIRGTWNKKKKRWGKGLFPDITSYWARHTWSTIASELDIPDAVIDMALVHKPLYKMSDIYIRRNQQKVDVALKTVSDYVNMKINEDKEKTSEK